MQASGSVDRCKGHAMSVPRLPGTTSYILRRVLADEHCWLLTALCLVEEGSGCIM